MIFAFFRRVWAVLLALALLVPAASAHEVTPSVVEFRVQDRVLFLDLRLNAEAVLAGVDLDAVEDTDQSPNAARYDSLRKLGSAELEAQIRDAFRDGMPGLRVESVGPLVLTYEGAQVPVTGETSLSRQTSVLLTAELPAGAQALRLFWPAGGGPLVLRQQGVEGPYTGYLNGGEASPAIPLAGGASLGPWESFRAQLGRGLAQIVADGGQLALMMLALFFLSLRPGAVLAQFAAFSLALIPAMALRGLGMIEVPVGLIPVLATASVMVIAIENVLVRRVHPWRLTLVFGCGALHGLALGALLAVPGQDPARALADLAGFTLGVELGLVAVLLASSAIFGVLIGPGPRYRGRVAIPASLGIAVVTGYRLAQMF